MTDDARTTTAGKTAAGVVLMLAILAGLVALFVFILVPSKAPVFPHPSLWDVIVDSRLIIGVLRLIGLVIAIYLVVSVIALLVDQRWVTAIGPIQTETRKAIKGAVAERDELADQLGRARQTINSQSTTIREMRTTLRLLASQSGMESAYDGGTGRDDDERSGPGTSEAK